MTTVLYSITYASIIPDNDHGDGLTSHIMAFSTPGAR